MVQHRTPEAIADVRECVDLRSSHPSWRGCPGRRGDVRRRPPLASLWTLWGAGGAVPGGDRGQVYCEGACRLTLPLLDGPPGSRG